MLTDGREGCRYSRPPNQPPAKLKQIFQIPKFGGEVQKLFEKFGGHGHFCPEKFGGHGHFYCIFLIYNIIMSIFASVKFKRIL